MSTLNLSKTHYQIVKEKGMFAREICRIEDQRLRAFRSLQHVKTITTTEGAADHTVAVHMGGSHRVKKFCGARLSGSGVAQGAVSLGPRGMDAAWMVEEPADVLHIYIEHQRIEQIIAEDGRMDPNTIEIEDCFAEHNPTIAHIAQQLVREYSQHAPP